MLVHGDCLNLLGDLEPESIDLCVFDPPYGIGDTQLHHKEKAWKKSAEEWDKFASVKEQKDLYSRVYEKIWKLLKPTGNIITFGSYHSIYLCGDILQSSCNAHIVNSIVWYKDNAMFNVNRCSLIESCEHMIWAAKSKDFYFDYERSKRYNGGTQLRNVWTSSITKTSERIGHPHQKPLWLLSRIVDICCPSDGVVLDPMCGSATTAIVCEARGLKYHCFEKDDGWFAEAQKRLEQEQSKSNMF